MVHYQNLLDEVEDTSQGETYHNKRFKQTAEEPGLLIEYNGRIGWSVTQPGELVRALEADMGWDTINLCRAVIRDLISWKRVPKSYFSNALSRYFDRHFDRSS